MLKLFRRVLHNSSVLDSLSGIAQNKYGLKLSIAYPLFGTKGTFKKQL